MSDEKDAMQLYLEDLTTEFEALDIESIEFEHARFAQWGDEESRNKLVVRAAPMVVAMVKRMGVPRNIFTDCVQAGNIEVIRAVESWDPRRGMTFTTWAAWKARKAISREWSRLTQDGEFSYDAGRFEAAAWIRGEGGEPEMTEFLEFANEVHLEVPKANEDNSELEQAVLSEQLREAILKLSRRQQQILVMHLDGATFSEVADSLGLSRQAVSQIYQRILVALRGFLVDDVDIH